MINYSSELFRWGVSKTHEEGVLEAALENDMPAKEFKENWESIIKNWGDVLAWRHLERFASPEGGATEREKFEF